MESLATTPFVDFYAYFDWFTPGFSPLHLAVMHQHMECVHTLLNADTDVNHRDGRSGRTALHHATETNNLNIARLILEQVSTPPPPKIHYVQRHFLI